MSPLGHLSSIVSGNGPPKDVGSITGPILLGNFFGYALFGVLCAQVFLYTFKFPTDSLRIKVFVWSLVFVETLMIVFATTAAWDFLAAGWGDLKVFAKSDWPLAGLAFMSGLVASATHAFFCWRIWVLRPAYRWLTGVIAVISALQWVTAAVCGARGLQPGTSTFNSTPFILVWLGGSSLCNLLITIAMMFIFLQAGIQSTINGVSTRAKLLVLTLETGMLTSLGTLIELLLFAVFPNNTVHFVLFFVLSKLYSNTVMAVLNARFYADVPDDKEFQQGQISTTIWDRRPPTEIGINEIAERRTEEAAPLWVRHSDRNPGLNSRTNLLQNELPKARPNLSTDPVPPIPMRLTPPPVPPKVGPNGELIQKYPPRGASATWF